MPVDQAEAVFHCQSEWAEPDDQFTMEDVHAAWNYCVGQLVTLISSIAVLGMFKVIPGDKTYAYRLYTADHWRCNEGDFLYVGLCSMYVCMYACMYVGYARYFLFARSDKNSSREPGVEAYALPKRKLFSSRQKDVSVNVMMYGAHKLCFL